MADVLPNVFPVVIPGVGTVKLVKRDKMRRKEDRRFFKKPDVQALVEEAPPPVPAVTDKSNGEKIAYPVLGNDQYGDCYYAAILHMVQSLTGQYGTQAQFDAAAVIARYEVLSGGDNGLSDSDVYPEWIAGILGPNGPNKIKDSLLISTSDKAAIDLAIWRFCGVLLTVSLPGDWANNASPGATWDVTNSPAVGGHAIILTGANAKGGFDLRTWGISPPINVTLAGLDSAQPEIIVVFSVENYDPVTHLSSAGFTWEEDAALWVQYGGKDPGPAPWGPTPPSPPVPPVPPPSGQLLVATPSSGPAPLSVVFTPVPQTSSGSVSYGDGTPNGPVTDPAHNPPHIYQQPGSYTPWLLDAAGNKLATTPYPVQVTGSPVPPVPPTPGGGFTGTLAFAAGLLQTVTPSADHAAVEEAFGKIKPLGPVAKAALLQLLLDIANKAPQATITADLMAFLAAWASGQ